jgi:hypothetical protein
MRLNLYLVLGLENQLNTRRWYMKHIGNMNSKGRVLCNTAPWLDLGLQQGQILKVSESLGYFTTLHQLLKVFRGEWDKVRLLSIMQRKDYCGKKSSWSIFKLLSVISVGMTTRLRAGLPRNVGSTSGSSKRFLYSAECPHCLRSLTTLLSDGYWGLFPRS